MSMWFQITAAGRLLQRRKGPVLRMILVALLGTIWCVVGSVWTLSTFRSIEQQAQTIQVDVFLRPAATDAEARALARTINALPSVDQARFVREQEVWQELSGDIDVDEELRDVVDLPRIVRFWPRAEHATLAELSATTANIERVYADRVDQVVWSRTLAEVVDARRRDLIMLGSIAGGLSIVMFILALIYAFRAEIHVAGGDLRVGTLLGARSMWIAFPHFFVSVISGAIGLLLAIAVIAAVVLYARSYVPWAESIRLEELAMIIGALGSFGLVVSWWQSISAGRKAVRQGA